VKAKKIVVPSIPPRKGDKKRRREWTPARLMAMIDPAKQVQFPTLVFRRRYPSLTFPVPPVLTPLYWFDRSMLDKKLIVALPPNTFLVDGRRFKVLAQDQHEVGRFSYTRWLVYEEAAVPKGQRP
jgi:hypothetical protein